MAKKFREMVIMPVLKLVGVVQTINSQSVRVLERNRSGYVTLSSGAFAVTDAGTNYAKGAVHIKTDGGVGSTFWVNEGDESSCDFNAMVATAGDITSVVAGDGLTGGATSGAATVDVVGGTGITANANDVAIATGYLPSHVVKFAGEFTTAGGDTAEAITVSGALATDLVHVTLHTKGATPRTIIAASADTDVVNVEMSGDPSTDHVLTYTVLRAVA